MRPHQLEARTFGLSLNIHKPPAGRQTNKVAEVRFHAHDDRIWFATWILGVDAVGTVDAVDVHVVGKSIGLIGASNRSEHVHEAKHEVLRIVEIDLVDLEQSEITFAFFRASNQTLDRIARAQVEFTNL